MKRPKLNVVKIGGNVINHPDQLSQFLSLFAALEGDKILIHGGGREATEMARGLGIPTTMIEGRRVTDESTLKIVTMTYAGLINKRIVAALQAIGCDAIGLSGADGNAIQATRRPAEPVDFGFVGDVKVSQVNTPLFTGLLAQGLAPVVCAITHDGNGQLLNTNADTVASVVASAMGQSGFDTDLTFCFEMPGVLADVDDESSVVGRITPSDFNRLVENGTIQGGMIPKISNALKAIKAGVSRVMIKHHLDLADTAAGTTITNG